MFAIRVALATSLFFGLAGCGMQSEAQRDLPSRNSDELSMPRSSVKPSTLPPVGTKLSDRDLEVFNRRSVSGTYKASYEIIDGDGKPLPVGEYTLARDGQQMAMIVGGVAIFVTERGEVVSCAEVDRDEYECEYDDGALEELLTLGGSLTEEQLDLITRAQRTDDRVILGRVTDCVEMSVLVKDESVTIETCLDRITGATLLQYFDGGDADFTVEALTLSEPDAADFELPAIPVR